MNRKEYLKEIERIAKRLVAIMPADLLWAIAASQGMFDALGGAEHERVCKSNGRTLADLLVGLQSVEDLIVKNAVYSDAPGLMHEFLFVDGSGAGESEIAQEFWDFHRPVYEHLDEKEIAELKELISEHEEI